jgi:cytochrome c556
MQTTSAPTLATRVLTILLALGAGLIGTALWAHGGDAKTPGELAVRYRHALYTAIGWNIGQMRGLLDAKETDFDRARFRRHAEHVAALAPLLPEAFPADSNLPGKTAAKPAVWSDSADFTQRLQTFASSAQSLAQLAASGSQTQLGPAFKDLTGQCKGCHDKYRQEE